MRRFAILLVCAAGCVVASKKEIHNDVSALQEENERLRAENERLRAEVEQLRTPVSRAIAGRVAQVDGTKIFLDVGGDDGVRVDDIFHLRRRGTFVGRITIRHVEKRKAMGEFDTQFPGKAAPPRRGDIAFVAHP